MVLSSVDREIFLEVEANLADPGVVKRAAVNGWLRAVKRLLQVNNWYESTIGAPVLVELHTS